MMKMCNIIVPAVLAAALCTTPAMAGETGSARLDRTTLLIKDMDESLAFWRDVMRFEVVFEPRILPKSNNSHIGWTDQAELRFARLQSPNGAGIGLMEIRQDDFRDLDIKDKPRGYGGMILVLVATDIEALYQRAVDADAVLKPLGLSRTGRSKQMYLRSPSGQLLEIYELLPKKAE